MNIAVVGSGIAGLLCARRLARRHAVQLFEAAPQLGGHIATVDVDIEGRSWPVDTGFIVFNEKTYPKYIELLGELGIAWRASNMSFSARCEQEDIEYNGSSLGQLFAQRRNLLRPAFLRMVRDILRFYSTAGSLLDEPGPGPSLGEYLAKGRYGREFIDWHLIPMGAAVWSSGADAMADFPAKFLVRFFANHGFLQLRDRPQWLTIPGGSREVERALVRDLEKAGVRIHRSTPVEGLVRGQEGVTLRTPQGSSIFDRVVLATHADQSLDILEDPTDLERELLGAFPYQANHVALHTDSSIMPRRRRAWAAWNSHVDAQQTARVQVTYWMNSLQGLEAKTPLLVTLNHSQALDPSRVLREFTYHHPVIQAQGVAAQARHAELNGSHRVYFAGAYWRYGFHEDGVRSALAVDEHMAREAARV